MTYPHEIWGGDTTGARRRSCRRRQDKSKSANRQTRGTQSSDSESERGRKMEYKRWIICWKWLRARLCLAGNFNFNSSQSAVQRVYLSMWWNSTSHHNRHRYPQQQQQLSKRVRCFSLCFLHFIYMSFQGESNSFTWHTAQYTNLVRYILISSLYESDRVWKQKIDSFFFLHEAAALLVLCSSDIRFSTV